MGPVAVRDHRQPLCELFVQLHARIQPDVLARPRLQVVPAMHVGGICNLAYIHKRQPPRPRPRMPPQSRIHPARDAALPPTLPRQPAPRAIRRPQRTLVRPPDLMINMPAALRRRKIHRIRDVILKPRQRPPMHRISMRPIHIPRPHHRRPARQRHGLPQMLPAEIKLPPNGVSPSHPLLK